MSSSLWEHCFPSVIWWSLSLSTCVHKRGPKAVSCEKQPEIFISLQLSVCVSLFDRSHRRHQVWTRMPMSFKARVQRQPCTQKAPRRVTNQPRETTRPSVTCHRPPLQHHMVSFTVSLVTCLAWCNVTYFVLWCHFSHVLCVRSYHLVV